VEISAGMRKGKRKVFCWTLAEGRETGQEERFAVSLDKLRTRLLEPGGGRVADSTAEVRVHAGIMTS